MEKLYLVVVRWAAQRPEVLDYAFSPVGDWFRYNPYTWLAWTDRSARDLVEIVRPKLRGTDSVVVVPVEPTEIVGWAPPEMWEWLKPKMTFTGADLPAGFRE